MRIHKQNWAKAIKAQKTRSDLAAGAADDLLGRYDVSAFDFYFSFENLESTSVEDSSKRLQILYHELYHLYQVTTQLVPMKFAGLVRYEIGVMAFLNHLYIGTGNSVNLSELNSLLELKEQVPLNPIFEEEFDKWAEEYSAFIDAFQERSSGFSIHQLLETAAYLAQKHLTRDFPEVLFELPAYYTDLHDAFCEKFSGLGNSQDLILYHLTIINQCMNVDEQKVKEAYQWTLKHFFRICSSARAGQYAPHTISDIFPRVFYEQEPDFYHVRFPQSDPAYEERLNRFVISMFGSSLHRSADLPDMPDKMDLSQEQISAALSSNGKCEDYPKPALQILLALEHDISQRFQTGREDRYEKIVQREHRAIHMVNAHMLSQHPSYLHPAFMLNISRSTEVINDLFKAYHAAWMTIAKEFRDPKSHSFKLGPALHSGDRQERKLSQDDMYFVDFTAHMRTILNLNRVVSGAQAYCCDTHRWQHLSSILNCKETGGLRWQAELIYGKKLSELLGV